MSTYDDASLIYYPSGYKEDKIYSLKPTDGSGDLTFTRASTATRVNSDGLIETASVLGSELVVNGDFATDSDWTKGSGWTISGGTANYDGVASIGDIQQSESLVLGKTYKYSFTISNRTQGGVRFFVGNTVGLTHSANGTFTGYITYSSGGYILLQARDSFIGSIDNVSVKEVITLNVPRIDYTGGGCGKLLLEPQRTNLVTYSENFNAASWLIQNSSVTSNAAISPTGYMDADKLVENTSNSTHRVLTSAGLTISGSVSISLFAKKAERSWVFIGNNNIVGAFFNLENGTIGTTGVGITPSIIDYGNGWYRCIITATAVANERIAIYTATADNTYSYTGDGTSGVYIYGAQIELGSYPTSYIPTTSTAVTRVADSSPNTSFLDYDSDFTFFYSSNTLNNGTQNKYYDSFLGYLSDFNVAALNLRIRYAGINYAMTSANTYFKLAIVKNSTNMKIFLDGVLKFTITTLPSGSANITLLESEVLSIMTFPTALSDAEAIALTTL